MSCALVGAPGALASAAAPDLAEATACAPYRLPPSIAAWRPLERSFLFRVHRAGVADSYLLATFHSSAAISKWSNVDLLFDGVRVFLAETRFSAESARRFSSLVVDERQDLLRILGVPLFDVVARRLRPYGIDASGAKIKTWSLAVTLAGSFDQTRSLDQFLSQKALDSGLPVVALQSADEIAASADALPSLDQIETLKDAACSYDLIQSQRAALESAYANDDVVSFSRELQSVTSSHLGVAERFERAFVTDRNLIFEERLLPEFEKGGAFVAIGAAHVMGPAGILAWLRRTGFQTDDFDRGALFTRLIADANSALPNPVPELMTWLRSKMTVPAGFREPTVSLVARDGDLRYVSGPSQDRIVAPASLARRLKQREPRPLASVLGTLIHQVQKAQSTERLSCAQWQVNDVQNVILRHRFLLERGDSGEGLKRGAVEDCQ